MCGDNLHSAPGSTKASTAIDVPPGLVWLLACRPFIEPKFVCSVPAMYVKDKICDWRRSEFATHLAHSLDSGRQSFLYLPTTRTILLHFQADVFAFSVCVKNCHVGRQPTFCARQYEGQRLLTMCRRGWFGFCPANH